METKEKIPQGVVLYRGPSAWDGEPIVAIATGLRNASKNPKTGPMVQVWIMREDIAPHVAARDGRDESVCGDCSARRSRGGHCYVSTFQGPRSVWEAYHAGNYDELEPDEIGPTLAGRRVRIGAYGDPAMVPEYVWRAVVSQAATWTGYTHQWDKPHADYLRGIVMASCDSDDEAREAREAGWRYFRVAAAGDASAMEREVECLSESRGMSCYDCGLCDGMRDSGLGKSVRITVHGAAAKRYRSLLVLAA